MKLIITGLFAGLILAVVLVVGLSVVRDSAKGHMFPMGYGVPYNNKMQVHIGVMKVVVDEDPPAMNSRGVPLWQKWQDEHFQLFDDTGTQIPLMKLGTSPIIERLNVGITFALWANVEMGREYTCRFVPYPPEAERYEAKFVVPDQPSCGHAFFGVPDEEDA